MRILTSILILFLLVGCPNPPDPEEELDTSVRLSTVNTWTQAVTIGIEVDSTINSWQFELFRDDSLILTSLVSSSDTIITDNNVSASSDYQYLCYFIDQDQIIDSSNVLSIHTIDSTSHDIDWTVEILGTMGIIRDVQIIDENNVWAVGQIRRDLTNSTGDVIGDTTYNVAHWDGNDWEFISAYNWPCRPL